MNKYPAISRLTLVLDYVTGIYRTKRQIARYLEENGHGKSDKTIERDFKFLEDWGYEIDKNQNRYMRKRNQDFENELLKRFSEVVKIKEIVNKESELLAYIYDTSTKMQGIELLPELLTALKQKRNVKFIYSKYEINEESIRKVIPLWLKEGEGIWYLIGLDLGKKGVRTFGLDRMRELKIMGEYDENLISDEIVQEIDNFKYMIGVSYPTFQTPELQFVQLGVSDRLLNYWKNTPIHLTQRITNEKIGEYTVVEFRLIPNIGLMKLIVSGMGDIKLIGPKNLKTYMQNNYKDLLEKVLD